MKLRASSLPLAFLCPGSVQEGLAVKETGPEANLGNAAHAAVRSLVERGDVDWDALPEIASQWEADVEELRMLCAMATTLWRKVESLFPDPYTEFAIDSESPASFRSADFPCQLTGHLDVTSCPIGSRVAHVADWKFGRKDQNYSQQVRGYCALILAGFNKDMESCTGTIFWVRDQEIEHYSMDRAGLAVWLESLRTRVLEWDGAYHPGPHCVYCPRSHACDARHAMARRDVGLVVSSSVVLSEAPTDPLADLSAENKIEMWHKAKTVEHYAKRVQDVLRAHLAKVGTIETDTTILRLVEEPRRSLRPLQAWPVLERHLSDEEIAGVVDVPITRLEDAVRKKAARGKGAAAVRALGEELAKAEAIEVENVKKVKEEAKR